MNLRPILACLVSMFSFFCLSAIQSDSLYQKPLKYQTLGLRIHKGKALAHTSGVKPIANSYPSGIELDYHWLVVNNSKSDLYKCFPKMGASLAYWDFGNPENFGYAITGMFTLESYFGLENKFSFSYKCGFGISYQNKPYNAETNTENLAFSTYVAFPLVLGIGGNMWLNDQWLLNVNTNFNHISNGGFRAPNLGLNWLSVGVGVDYYFTAPQLKHKQIADWKQLRLPKNRLDFNVYSGFKELYPSYNFSIPGVEIKGSHRFARINAVTLGFEYIYDRGMSDNYKTEHEIENYNKLSMAIGHEFLLGRFNFSQQFGFYLYNPYHAKSEMYQRYGLVYFITPFLQAGINLKSYFEKAQFVDLRIGYSFRK